MGSDGQKIRNLPRFLKNLVWVFQGVWLILLNLIIMTGTIMNKDAHLTLVLGGTRSGKSVYAESLLKPFQNGRVLYVATAECWEGEGTMKERISRHQERRPSSWKTLEAPVSLGEKIGESLREESFDAVMIDCMTLFVSNVMMRLSDEGDSAELEKKLEEEIASLLGVVDLFPCHWVIVSGETGLGIMPDNRAGRLFCDALGLVNQLLASQADRTVLVVAGKTLELN